MAGIGLTIGNLGAVLGHARATQLGQFHGPSSTPDWLRPRAGLEKRYIFIFTKATFGDLGAVLGLVGATWCMPWGRLEPSRGPPSTLD